MELDFDSDPEVKVIFMSFVLLEFCFGIIFYLLILVLWWLQDICVSGDAKTKAKGINRTIKEQHIANRLRHSLRVSVGCRSCTKLYGQLSLFLFPHYSQVYLSILYLRIPESFSILLRGRVVVYHNIAMDLKYPEFILYKPHSGGCVEVGFNFFFFFEKHCFTV